MISHSNEDERAYLKEYAVMEIDIINQSSSNRYLTDKECRALDFAMETITQLNMRKPKNSYWIMINA